jgi:hypothetical protein
VHQHPLHRYRHRRDRCCCWVISCDLSISLLFVVVVCCCCLSSRCVKLRKSLRHRHGWIHFESNSSTLFNQGDACIDAWFGWCWYGASLAALGGCWRYKQLTSVDTLSLALLRSCALALLRSCALALSLQPVLTLIINTKQAKHRFFTN